MSYAIPANGVTTAKIADGAVTTAKIADGAITPTKRAVLGQQISASSGTFSNTGSADVTNLSVTITTLGRPVFVGLIPDGSANNSRIGVEVGSNIYSSVFSLIRGSTDIARALISGNGQGVSSISGYIPPSSLYTIDPVAAGTYTYKAAVSASGNTARVEYTKLIAYEL